MNSWKTRLEVRSGTEKVVSRWISFKRGFLQGDSFSPIGFCISEIPVAMLLKASSGYRMGPPGRRRIRKAHSLFVDDLKVYQEGEETMKIVNETIVRASVDTVARYGVKKCAEAKFHKGKMVHSEGMEILNERMKSLDPTEGDVYKFLGLDQNEGIERNEVYRKIENTMIERLSKIVDLELNDKNMMNAINSRVIPVATYPMNVITFTKTELTEFNMLIKRILRNKNMHGRQGSNERLYLCREEGGRGLIDLEEAYQKTKIRIACYMSLSSDQYIQTAWERELRKTGPSINREALEALFAVGIEAEFGVGYVIVENRRWAEGSYPEVFQKLKDIFVKERREKRKHEYIQKKLQSEYWLNQEKESHIWLKGNLAPEKTASIIQMLEQMNETRAWKKIRGLQVDNDLCRLCRGERETVQHILSGCKILANQEYLKRHNRVLSVFTAEWCKYNGIIEKDIKWYKMEWKTGQVIEKNGIKVLWDFQFSSRKKNQSRRPDLIIEDNNQKLIYIVDMACPMERNIEKKATEKLTNYQQLAYEFRERRPGYKVVIIPLILGCCGGGAKILKRNIAKVLEDEKLINTILCEMVKVVLMDSETIMRKFLSGLIQAE